MTKQSHDGVTIYDVARVAGVAASTVSRTFAQPGRVNAATAARVREAAEQLGYRPPQGTHQPQARLIGLMVSDVANPFFTPVIRGAQIAANELGFEVLLADSRESASREQAALERLTPVVQGFLIGNTRMIFEAS